MRRYGKGWENGWTRFESLPKGLKETRYYHVPQGKFSERMKER